MSLRADGRENRLRLLDAAEAAFAEKGFDVPLETIATRAGVSRMTLYRRFKDRETLCMAVLERNVVLLEERAEALKDNPNACLEIIDMMMVMFTTNQIMVDGLSRQPEHLTQINSLRQRVVDLLAVPLLKAQEVGKIKKDMKKEDLALVMYMLGAAVGDGSLEARTARVQRAQNILQYGFMCTDNEAKAESLSVDSSARGTRQDNGGRR